jgi:hypothetical protein
MNPLAMSRRAAFRSSEIHTAPVTMVDLRTSQLQNEALVREMRDDLAQQLDARLGTALTAISKLRSLVHELSRCYCLAR